MYLAQGILLLLAFFTGYCGSYPGLARKDRMKFAAGGILLALPAFIGLATKAIHG